MFKSLIVEHGRKPLRTFLEKELSDFDEDEEFHLLAVGNNR